MNEPLTDAEILAQVPLHCYECGGLEYAEEQALEAKKKVTDLANNDHNANKDVANPPINRGIGDSDE